MKIILWNDKLRGRKEENENGRQPWILPPLKSCSRSNVSLTVMNPAVTGN